MRHSPGKTSLEGRRVMLVEDEWLIALDVKGFLERQGCTVAGPAGSVAAAIALLDEAQPDAAVLDLNLKGDYAIGVARALLARGVPFVIVTGYNKGQVTSPELQNVPHLSKPVNHSHLLGALRQVLST